MFAEHPQHYHFSSVPLKGEDSILAHYYVTKKGQTPHPLTAPYVEELKKMNIGIPQITHLTYLLIKEGIPLPRPAISVEEAEKMLAEILKEEKPL